MKKYLYIAQYYDRFGRDLKINDKKIGITDNLKNRVKDLSGTKAPLGITFIKAWEFEDSKKVETALHNALIRRNKIGEWFEDEDDTLTDGVTGIINLIEAKEVEMDESMANIEVVNEIKNATIICQEKKDQYPKDFTKGGKRYMHKSMPKGSTKLVPAIYVAGGKGETFRPYIFFGNSQTYDGNKTSEFIIDLGYTIRSINKYEVLIQDCNWDEALEIYRRMHKELEKL